MCIRDSTYFRRNRHGNQWPNSTKSRKTSVRNGKRKSGYLDVYKRQGQRVDVEYTDRPVTKSQLEFIYELKTAALLEAAMMIGAVLAGADDNQVKAAEQIAHHVGMAFQIRDDILDVISTTEELGRFV